MPSGRGDIPSFLPSTGIYSGIAPVRHQIPLLLVSTRRKCPFWDTQVFHAQALTCSIEQQYDILHTRTCLGSKTMSRCQHRLRRRNGEIITRRTKAQSTPSNFLSTPKKMIRNGPAQLLLAAAHYIFFFLVIFLPARVIYRQRKLLDDTSSFRSCHHQMLLTKALMTCGSTN